MSNLIQSSEIREKFTSTGRISGYIVDLHHTGLSESKSLTAVDRCALSTKVNHQTAIWDTKWKNELLYKSMDSKEENANMQTNHAQKILRNLEHLLEHSLDSDHIIDWESLKQKDQFKSITSKKLDYISYAENGYPEKLDTIQEKLLPKEDDFFIKIGFFKKLFKQEKNVRSQQKQKFILASNAIEFENKKIRNDNIKRENQFKEQKKKWEEEYNQFQIAQDDHNNKIDTLEKLYQEKNANAVIRYCEMVLENSSYIDSFPKEFDIDYTQANSLLLVDYELPAISNMPSINEVKYIRSRDALEVKNLSQTALEKLYNSAVYQIALRTIYELFNADQVGAISSIIFNGFVTSVNLGNGHTQRTCIMSVQTSDIEFKKINLKGIIANQSYKECFKSLRGVGSTKMSTMTAISPILQMDKSDKRFRDHYEVASSLNEEMNLAVMDWEDFEHLVREVFEKEFATNGGEVRVTQASSDGGVDAIAFDPDPIRGGKIVIQAKRYTNVVGVSAVRDLYGTMQHEGATKGILVTTSDFGSDSYEFVKGKPLTLLNGSNLLHLLKKHGHSAKIDIKEAKRILSEKKDA